MRGPGDRARAGLATDEIWERLSAAVARFDGLSVAALNGTLAGGAFGMALACDLRIAVPEATFFYPSMRLGFLPQPSDALRLEALAAGSEERERREADLSSTENITPLTPHPRPIHISTTPLRHLPWLVHAPLDGNEGDDQSGVSRQRACVFMRGAL